LQGRGASGNRTAKPNLVLRLHRDLYVLGTSGDAHHLVEHLGVAGGLVAGNAGSFGLLIEGVEPGVEGLLLGKGPRLAWESGDGLAGVELAGSGSDNAIRRTR
jgi:hypothetical protein